MRKTARPVVWEGAGSQSGPRPDRRGEWKMIWAKKSPLPDVLASNAPRCNTRSKARTGIVRRIAVVLGLVDWVRLLLYVSTSYAFHSCLRQEKTMYDKPDGELSR